MRSVANELGIQPVHCRISSNKGGNAVGGEVTFSAPQWGIFINLSSPINGYGEPDLCGASYARKATPQDPYGAGPSSPNHPIRCGSDGFPTLNLAELCREIKAIDAYLNVRR